jgi:hypothetical protein
MISHRCGLGCLRPRLLAVLVLCLLPGAGPAESLYFQNKCDAPVVLQATSVFRGAVWRGRPCLLKPGDTTPAIAMPGNKIITVLDPKVPNRVLFQGAIPAGVMDLRFNIVPDLPPPRVRMQRTPPPFVPGP